MTLINYNQLSCMQGPIKLIRPVLAVQANLKRTDKYSKQVSCWTGPLFTHEPIPVDDQEDTCWPHICTFRLGPRFASLACQSVLVSSLVYVTEALYSLLAELYENIAGDGCLRHERSQ